MPKKIYTEVQTQALGQVSEWHRSKIMERRTIEKEIRETLSQRLQAYSERESKAANEALEIGVTKKDIAHALGTGNWDSLHEILNLTKNEVMF